MYIAVDIPGNGGLEFTESVAVLFGWDGFAAPGKNPALEKLACSVSVLKYTIAQAFTLFSM